jgi:membrane-associated phospholipid phosphatase
MAWDRHLERWVVEHRVGFLNPVFEGLSYAGSYGALWLAIAIVFALLRRRPEIFVSALVADVLGELSTDALKAAIPRSRPHLHPLVSVPHTHSFPSGHAAISFACATVVGAAEPRARLPLYVLAALVAWSRVYVGVHYPSDVAAGALIGIALGYVVIRALPLLARARRRSRRTRRAG